jgi:predicted ATPase
LPPQPTPFIGRQQELAEIRRLLQAEPACRLLTLVGPGGIGKTRLALAAAAAATDLFPHGVHFAGLAPVEAASFLVSAIAAAVGLTLSGDAQPETQLLNYLRQKKLLLLLDNFEHLLAGAPLLPEILNAAPQVSLLVTSRERLSLQEEWSYELRGLPYPRPNGDLVEAAPALETYSAVQLFIQSARRAEVNYALSAEDIPAVLQICRLVDGLPLGLELAAPWVRSLTCREIAAEIERNLDFLTTPLRNVPERQRSLSAVFQQTWQRLSPAEQMVLSRLSTFQGGCLREAAEQVAGATLALLSALVDKALLRRRHGRYELHELTRQFAAEQLATAPEDRVRVLHRCCAYYTTFLQQRARDLKSSGQKKALAEITAEVDNIRAAWRWAVAHRDAPALDHAAEGLWLFYDMRETLYEAVAAFQQAVLAFIPAPLDQETLLTQASTLTATEKSLVGFLLAAWGYFSAEQGDLAGGRLKLEGGLALLHQAGPRDSYQAAFARMHLGYVLLLQGRYPEAQQVGQACLPLFEGSSDLADRWGQGMCFQLLAGCAQEQGRLTQAGQFLQQGLAICREIGDRRLQGFLIQNLGIIAVTQGEYAQANRYLDEALAISREFDDLFGLADTLHELAGPLAIAQGRYTQAEQLIRESMAIYGELGRSSEAGALLYLGAAFRLQGHAEAAGQLYRDSLTASQAMGHRSLTALCLGELGCLAFARQDYHLAETLQQEALAIWGQIGHEPELASTLRHLGHIAIAADQTRRAEARQYFEEALQLALKHGLPPLVLDIFTGVAPLLAQTGESQAAVELLSLAANHPAGTHETTEKAQNSLAELTITLPSNLARAANVPDRLPDWQIIAKQLLDKLSGLTTTENQNSL